MIAKVIKPDERAAAIAPRGQVFLEAACAPRPDVLPVAGYQHRPLLPDHDQDPDLIERGPDAAGHLRAVPTARMRIAGKTRGPTGVEDFVRRAYIQGPPKPAGTWDFEQPGGAGYRTTAADDLH